MASSRRRLWILNLDGEHELEARRSYAPTRHLAAIVEQARTKLWHSATPLVQPGDLVLADPATEVSRLSSHRGPVACLAINGEQEALAVQLDRQELAACEGRMWLPTTRARSALEGLGMQSEAAPDPEVLKVVNARAFAARVREGLVGGDAPGLKKVIVGSLAAALEKLAEPRDLGWLVRRPFGAAGRGRRRLAGLPSPAELDWLKASLRLGPLVIEPFVKITAEFTRSGHVTEAGVVLTSPPCFQATTSEGAWIRTEAAGPNEVNGRDDAELAQALETAGRALAAAGYFGAFGIDAFRYRDSGGVERLNPLSEINARYTMDWALAMGPSRLTT